MENVCEANEWRKSNKEVLARCMMAIGYLLIMEYVDPVSGVLPQWCEEFDDQVGYNKKGKLVAYDYGC